MANKARKHPHSDETARLSAALDATYEIDVLVALLQRERASGAPFEILLPAMLRRINDLNSVVMSVHGGDDTRTTEEMQKVVYG